MLIVLDSTAACARLEHRLVQAGARVQAFPDARPPLIAVIDGATEADVRGEDGVVDVRPARGPFLSTRALGPPVTVTVGDVVFGGDVVPVIAGPCSVDDEDRLVRIAGGVRDAGAAALRAGVKKARTWPWAYSGPGTAGLSALRRAAAHSGLPVVSEVLGVEDVEAFAEVVDLLQVGARNMQNIPLLRRLGRVRRPVLLKRGFGCTVDELLGAADHVLCAGNPNVILCERGIRTFEGGVRFSFDLSALALLKERTRLPVVVDPSHAAGDARLVPAIARGAVAAGADGLLVEVHDRPAEALSDREQALPLAALPAFIADVDRVARAVSRTVLAEGRR